MRRQTEQEEYKTNKETETKADCDNGKDVAFVNAR